MTQLYSNGLSVNPVTGKLVNTSSGMTITGLGDSITAQSSCQIGNTPDSRFPAWLPNTTYSLNQTVQAGGAPFRCTQAGVSASSGTGPSGIGSSIADGTVTWASYAPQSSKMGSGGFLGWAEALSLGALNYDMSLGYSGLIYGLKKVIVINGGSGYSANPTLTFAANSGSAATATVVNGVITAVTVTNAGYSSTPSITVTDSTGSGAVLSAVSDGAGNFGVAGCQTRDMVARLPDVVASRAQIVTVLGGTNDTVAGTAATVTIANLQTIYETLMDAGKCVIAMPIHPRSGLTLTQSIARMRINRWIRAYCRGAQWANPNGYTNIALADCEGLLVDGSVLTISQPVGGSAGGLAAVTNDGIHIGTLGAAFVGSVVWQAAQKFTGPPLLQSPRPYSAFDGSDINLNPGGNCFEALPWQANTAYVMGQSCSNNGNVYACTVGGTSASSGGPSGTAGGSITDGTATWGYAQHPVGLSVLASGTAGVNTAASGVTYNGSLASGLTLSRTDGSATTTVTESIESPWSDGHVGQRQVLQFSLSGGASLERFKLAILNSYPAYFCGVTAADIANGTQFFLEAEVEINSQTNLTGLYLSGPVIATGTNLAGPTTTPSAPSLPQPSGLITIPNNGRLMLRTMPIVIPTATSSLQASLFFCFNALTSASATIKINSLAMRRHGIA